MNPTHRYFLTVVALYLTYVLGLSFLTHTTPQTNTVAVEATPLKSVASTPAQKRHPITSPKKMARVWMLKKIDAPYVEWQCASKIIHKESRWIPNLWNAQGSTAYGLGQVKGSYKYTKNKPLKQFKVALRYMIHRYQTPCNAWKAWLEQGYY